MKPWKLEGYNTFEGEYYSLEGEFDSKEAAEAAADDQLKKLEQEQPTATSVGESAEGIQDRVYIVQPDGGKYRYIPFTFTRAQVIAKDAGDLLIRRAEGKGENLPPPHIGCAGWREGIRDRDWRIEGIYCTSQRIKDSTRTKELAGCFASSVGRC